MKKNVLIACVTAGIAIVAGGFWILQHPTTDNSPAASTASSSKAGGSRLPIVDAKGLSGFDERERAIIQQLRTKYGSHIVGTALQVEVIANLMDLLQKLYPGDWESRLIRILAAAFPQQAAELLDRYDALRDYNAWLKDGLPQLTFPDHASRQRALWEKRISVFGDAAYEIWAQELREEKLAATLKDLNASTAPLQEKADTYISSLRETYGDAIIGQNAPHLTQNMTRFLKLDSVQRDLRSMPVEQRKESLREFRREMGLDAPAIQRWDQLDTERDNSRSIGSTYMTERSQLEKQYQGAALEQQLVQLQNRLFGEAEAQFIRNEEASGHFRYNTAQTLGVN